MLASDHANKKNKSTTHNDKRVDYSNTKHDPAEIEPLTSDPETNRKSEYYATKEDATKERRHCEALSDGTHRDDELLAKNAKTELFRWQNIAIPWCYLTVGLCQGLSGTLLNVYPLDLGASEAQQGTVAVLVNVAAIFKIAFGFLSDNYPLYRGYRRKPYMLVGWLMACASMMLLLSFGGDFGMSYDEETGMAIPPPNPPSLNTLSVAFLVFGIGFWMADVMGDTIVTERVRLESEAAAGTLQSTCYACRFFGIMVAAPFSTYVYSAFGPGFVIRLLAWTPLPMVPLIYMLQEDSTSDIRSTKAQMMEIWETICKRSVWYPLGFIYLFNLLQVQNLAWRQFLREVLSFTATDLNSLFVVSYIFVFAGVMIYKWFFLKVSWRRIYLISMLVNGMLSAFQLMLITGVPSALGLSNFWFALGDDAAAEFVSGILFLPNVMIYAALCPEGSEGASYAMFTTASNCAINMIPALSTMLLPIWDVSADALEGGDLQGLFNLSILTALIQLSPLLILNWLPAYRHDLFALAAKPLSQRNGRIGGTLFLLVLASSMLYIVTVDILNIVDPGWMGES